MSSNVITAESLNKIPLSYATPSLGMHSSHTLPDKISAASDAGFTGIEIGFPDLLAYTISKYSVAALHGAEWAPDEPDPFDHDEQAWTALANTAHEIRADLNRRGMKVTLLQPFSQYEGWRDNGVRRKWVWRKAERWLDLAHILKAEALQIGSTDETAVENDYDIFAEDLAKIADAAAAYSPPIKISYEPWCWGAYVWDWEQTWDVVKRANRDNILLCLDTFQIAGAIYADPASADGLNHTHDDPRHALATSLDRLSKTLPASKIHILQISDALRMDPPLPKEKDGTPARENWSHSYRPLPYAGGYLPVADVARAVLQTGFRGWFSMEVFLEADQAKDDPSVPQRWARGGREAYEKMVKEILEFEQLSM